MSSNSNFTNMTTQTNKNLKKREQGMTFTATMKVPNKRLLSALEESEDIINGKINAKRYKNFDAMINDLD